MTTNTHVTRKTGELLKEAGFDLPVLRYYYNHKPEVIKSRRLNYNSFPVNSGYACSAPTLQEAIEWLEQKLDVAIWLEWDSETHIWSGNVLHQHGEWSDMGITLMGWHLKNEALENTILAALKHVR